jgi:hypothetical protein
LSDFYFFGTDLKKVVALNVQMTAKNKSGKKKKPSLYYCDQNKDKIGQAHKQKWEK